MVKWWLALLTEYILRFVQEISSINQNLLGNNPIMLTSKQVGLHPKNIKGMNVKDKTHQIYSTGFDVKRNVKDEAESSGCVRVYVRPQ